MAKTLFLSPPFTISQPLFLLIPHSSHCLSLGGSGDVFKFPFVFFSFYRSGSTIHLSQNFFCIYVRIYRSNASPPCVAPKENFSVLVSLKICVLHFIFFISVVPFLLPIVKTSSRACFQAGVNFLLCFSPPILHCPEGDRAWKTASRTYIPSGSWIQPSIGYQTG